MFNDLNMSKRTEIGSEFWFEEVLPQAVADRDGVYAVSGRTAIDLIIQDILEKREVRSVLMPAWCCDSMIAPFLARGVRVEFYDVSWGGDVPAEFADLAEDADSAEDADVFYVTNYFGYENMLPLETVERFRKTGAVVLYDRTHSLFLDHDPYIALADYSFASIRKWMGVVGGAVVDGVSDKDLKQCPYLNPKETAMKMKRAFMAGDDSVDKQEFLRLYGEFGHHLAEDYRDYAMDNLSYAIYKTADLSAIRTRRRENAKYLHEHLDLQFMSPLTDQACPLFVPVFFDTKDERDRVRKKLIEAEIYCPIHWPKPSMIPGDYEANKIYDRELSLICDQRYDIADMERIAKQMNHR